MTETVVNVQQEAPNNNAAPNKPQGNDQPLGWIKINLDYFKTTPGLLKIAEFVSTPTNIKNQVYIGTSINI